MTKKTEDEKTANVKEKMKELTITEVTDCREMTLGSTDFTRKEENGF